MSHLSWLAPGLVVSLAVSLAASGPVGQALGVRRLVGWALVMTLGIILSITLTPLRGALDYGASGGSCDLTRIGPAPLAELVGADETSWNVLLFMPLGVIIALAPATRRRATIIVAAVALPFAIESIQLLVPVLGRACQSADIADNLIGLLLGFGVGMAATRGAASTRGRGSDHEAKPG